MPKGSRQAGLWAALMLVSLLPGRSQAASFDCAKAASPIEKAICADKTVSALDEQVSARYRALAHGLPHESQALLREDQRRWLRERDSANTPAKLSAAYKQRLSELEAKRQALAGVPGWQFGEFDVVHNVMMFNTNTQEWDDDGPAPDSYELRKAGEKAIAFQIGVVGDNAGQCEVEGKASLQNSGEYIWTGSTANDPLGENQPTAKQDLCTIRIAIAKDAVRIHTEGEGDACDRGCGLHASLSDEVVLLPVQKTKN